MLGLTIDTANDDTPMIPSEIKSPNDQTDHEQHSKKKFDYWAEFAKLPRSENEPGSEKYAHGIVRQISFMEKSEIPMKLVNFVEFCEHMAIERKSYNDRVVFTFVKNFFADDEDQTIYIKSTTSDISKFPIFIYTVTLLQMFFFILYHASNSKHGEIRDSPLIFNPNDMKWTYPLVTYTLLHEDLLHFVQNLILQLVFGIPLEIVHGIIPILSIYIFGAVFGALCHTLFSANLLAGCSGAVFALLFGQIANVFLNFKQMKLLLIKLIILSAVIIYVAYFTYQDIAESISSSDEISHSAHFGGALIGLAVGLIVLKNFKNEHYEKIVKIITGIICVLLTIGGIVFFTIKVISQNQII